MQRLGFTVIDSEGYRPNVGIILCNTDGRLFWAKRIGQHSWQFPQGGIRQDESPEQAMFRELAEEIGLRPDHVQVIGSTQGWLRYRLPDRLIRNGGDRPACVGQKQVWFLLRMVGEEEQVRLDLSEHPEFDHWQWVDYWYPLQAVVPFKRYVYWRALHELAPLALPDYSADRAAVRQRTDRPALAIRPVTILPLRSATGRNPVITRMVVATRRVILEADSATPTSIEDIRPLRPTAPDPQHRAFRR